MVSELVDEGPCLSQQLFVASKNIALLPLSYRAVTMLRMSICLQAVGKSVGTLGCKHRRPASA
jgi:hypothetical protein